METSVSRDKTEDALLQTRNDKTADESLESDLSLVDVLMGRAASYRMFSRIFLSPLRDSDIDDFIARDFISMALEFEDNELLAEGFNDIGRALKRRSTGTRQQLATDYTMCFDGVEAIDGEVAVPYASVYLGSEALLNQEPRHEVYQIFRAESVKLRSSINLPEDHLSFELDFLSLLSTRAAEALEAGDTAEVLRILDVSQSFIVDNILSWLDLLTERANQVLKTRFYKGALKATKGYLKLDQSVIAGVKEMLTHE